MKGALKSLIALIFLLAPVSLAGQHQDLQMWTSLGLRLDLSQKFRIGLEEEIRYFDNISRLDKINSEVTLDYQFAGDFSAGLMYRLISNRNARGYYSNDHRFDVHVEYQKGYGPWSWAAQLALQKTYDAFNRSRDWQLPENYTRIEGEIARELKNKNTEPYINLELWYLMPQGRPDFIDQYRLTIGIKHRVNKINRWNFYYRIQQEIQVSDPLFAHIIGIGYTYVWKR